MKAYLWSAGLATLLAAVVATGVAAQDGERLSRECRREIVGMCGFTFDRRKMIACVRDKFDTMSDGCRKQIAERMARKATPLPGQLELSYGRNVKQRLDFVAPTGVSKPVPLIIYIHGGGWSIGDKGRGGTTKATHFTKGGYAFASLNYRLVPDVTVEQQGADVAAAIAYLRANAQMLGVDGDRMVIMGHSAGAHLAALVSSDPAYLKAAHVPMAAIRGTILLDGAAYDVSRQMADPRNRLPQVYKAAFGDDPKRQAALSPIKHAAGPNVANWLILPVASRADSSAQSDALASALRQGGSQATVTPVPDSTHMKLNKNLGIDGDFATERVDAFVQVVLR